VHDWKVDRDAVLVRRCGLRPRVFDEHYWGAAKRAWYEIAVEAKNWFAEAGLRRLEHHAGTGKTREKLSKVVGLRSGRRLRRDVASI
jgi:hypothetical protein